MKTIKETIANGFLRLKKADYRHFICIGITLGFIACSVFIFPYALGRLIETLRDFGLSCGYYFCDIFDIGIVVPSVNSLSKMPFELPFNLPSTWEEFKVVFGKYWQVWMSKENILEYFDLLSDLIYVLAQIVLCLIPFFVVLYVLLKRLLDNENNDYNKDSKSLVRFKKISDKIYRPVKFWIIDFIRFVKENKTYKTLWICIWLFNFNGFAIIFAFLAYYFYFIVSFDLLNLYRQFYKLVLDLSAVLDFIPLWGWLLISYIVFCKIRANIGYSVMNHNERKNRGFINERPVVSMVCATMGKKKTTMISDMALSQDVMFRDKAFEKILENDLKFPFFPWINLENAIKKEMAKHIVYNLATTRQFVENAYKKFRKRRTQKNLFGYDFVRYGLFYNDDLKTVNVWEIIETYAQLYFVYIIESSLLIANYSIRTDNLISDVGNFPMWNMEFFRRDSRLTDSFSRHAHILDFDSLRLGKRVCERNQNADSFEFGVVVITEVGKERGNSVELTEKKKSDSTANQKNDLFNSWLKMVRHSATIDSFPFVKVITDEQRPESWGADARDLCEIVYIRESSPFRLALPFFSLADLLYDWLFAKFTNLYYEYRYSRGDNTLPMYLLKNFVSFFHGIYKRIYNRFGVCELSLQVESGTQDGQIVENKYYLMSKKIYSKRFSTDCFSDFFTVKALRSPVGINDLKEYETEKASFNELTEQNSYFMNDILSGFLNQK